MNARALTRGWLHRLDGTTSARFRWPALLALASVAAIAFDQGGYFPTAWGWASLAFLWVTGLALVLRQTVRLDPAQILLVLAWTTLLGWTALSITWSIDPAQTVLEVQRSLVYVSAVAMLVLVSRARSRRYLLGGLLCAIGAVSLFSLATRLFPNVLRVYDPTAINRLAQPLGYWNSLSAFTALGLVLALGFAARARNLLTRAVSAALLVPLLATFYFTFGRTGWVALAAGSVAAFAIDHRRAQLLSLLVALAPFLTLDVWLSSRRPGLTHAHSTLAVATRDGHRLALLLAVLAVIVAAVSFMFAVVEARTTVPSAARVAFALLLATACAAGVGVVFARYGDPVTLARHAWRDFRAPPSQAANLNSRLLSLSGNGRYQLWTLALDDARAHPWVGSGAGSFERYFLRNQPADVSRVRDAHSLYIETLAELGPPGLVLLLVALGMPLVVAARRRRGPLTAVAVGAYVVFLVHAASDWDWELPAVPLAAIVCAVVLVLGERERGERQPLSAARRAIAVVVTAGAGLFALVGLIGNSALAASRSDLTAGRLASAQTQARRAATWAPWSPDPWDSLGNAQLAARDPAAARASFRKGLSIDRRDWQLWYDLARATSGKARRRATAESLALYPRSGLSGTTDNSGASGVTPP